MPSAVATHPPPPPHPALPACPTRACSRGEDLLVQRYISTRPMFTNLREAQFVAQQQAAQAAQAAGGAAVDEAAAADAAAAADLASLRGLSGLYKGILLAMRDEAVVIEQV